MLSKLHMLVPNGGRPYCEPFCGGASLFFSREPAPVEVLNDLNEDIVNLFRVLQDRQMFEELRHRIMWTPYARSEFKRALEMPPDAPAIDRAWATFVGFNMGFGGKFSTIGNFGRVFTSGNGCARITNSWIMRLSMLDAFHHRLMMVQIDCMDAIQCIQYWDTPETVFYVDPPYVHSTRVYKNSYLFARKAPAFRPGMDSADGAAVLEAQSGVRCCSMYWRTMEIGAPPQLDAK